MTRIVLTSPRPLSGKTTVAAAIAAQARSRGVSFTLERSGDDDNAAADKALFAALAPGSDDAQLSIIETPSADSVAQSDGKVIVVAPFDLVPSEIVAFANGSAGVVVNKVPPRRREKIEAAYQSAGVTVLAIIPEDRTLGAPSLSEVITALKAEASHVNGAGSLAIDKPVIASISSDPGQTYFAREDPSAVIVRSDKPDLQLAALNAGARSLIVTGSLPLLSYVLDRAEEDEIPLLRTDMDTVQVVEAIEQLFGGIPFSGGEAKIARLTDLLAEAPLLDLISG